MFLESPSSDLFLDVLVSASLHLLPSFFAGGLALVWDPGGLPPFRGDFAVTPRRSRSLSSLQLAVVRFTMEGLDLVFDGSRPRCRLELVVSPRRVSLSSLQRSVVRFTMEGLILVAVGRKAAGWCRQWSVSSGSSFPFWRWNFDCGVLVVTDFVGIEDGVGFSFCSCFIFTLFFVESPWLCLLSELVGVIDNFEQVSSIPCLILLFYSRYGSRVLADSPRRCHGLFPGFNSGLNQSLWGNLLQMWTPSLQSQVQTRRSIESLMRSCLNISINRAKNCAEFMVFMPCSDFRVGISSCCSVAVTRSKSSIHQIFSFALICICCIGFSIEYSVYLVSLLVLKCNLNSLYRLKFVE